MKHISIVLWTLLCVVAALLFITAIFIHNSIWTALLTIGCAGICYNWWHDEISHQFE